jgi:TonB family protein
MNFPNRTIITVLIPMNFKRLKYFLLTLIFCAENFAVIAQLKENGTKNYDAGNRFMAAKDFTKAIECYTISIAQFPSADVYFNRALCYNNLHDSCNFCNDVYMASLFKDTEAAALYKKHCVTFDSIRESADSILEEFPGYNYTKFTKEKCREKVKNYFDVNRKEIKSKYVKMPEYPGGEEALFRFLGTNIFYPMVAKESGIQGVVYVSLDVGINGGLSNIKIIKGIGGGCDEEVLRVVHLMPKWKPGSRKGILQKVTLTMPCKFTLN